MRVRVAAVVLSAGLLAAGCGDDSWVSRPEPSRNPAPAAFSDATTVPTTTSLVVAPGMEVEREGLAAARQRWADQSSDTYRYVIERACICEEARAAILVSVQQDSVTAALEVGPVEVEVDDTAHAVTVDELFDEIETALGSGQLVAATYEPTTGVPTLVDLDTEAPGVEIRTRTFSDITGGRADLIEAQGRWDEAGFSAYRWVYGVITLEGLQEVSASVANGVGDGGLSVEEVYALIAEAHVNPDRTVTATYDAELGLPLQVAIEQPMNPDELPFAFTGVISVEPS